MALYHSSIGLEVARGSTHRQDDDKAIGPSSLKEKGILAKRADFYLFPEKQNMRS
jgi:hypothetical protein